jgi:hypothetical protein
VALLCGGAFWSGGCTDDGKGDLVVRWEVKSPMPDDEQPCATASINQIHVQLSKDPEQPSTEWPIFRFACSQKEVRLELEEGIYTVKIYKQTPSGVTEIETIPHVQVLSGTVRDWAGPFPPEPLDANDINIFWCGNAVREPDGGEECDEGEENSDTEPDTCRTSCVSPFCGDGVADSGETCDGSDLRGVSCEDLGLAGDVPACTADCELDESACEPAAGPLTLRWTVLTSDATSISDCETESIRYVRYSIQPRDQSQIVAQGVADCLPWETVVEQLAFGIYTIYLEGLSSSLETVASGFVATHNHNMITGTTADASLIASP